jgi:hypothetical protein
MGHVLIILSPLAKCVSAGRLELPANGLVDHMRT